MKNEVRRVVMVIRFNYLCGWNHDVYCPARTIYGGLTGYAVLDSKPVSTRKHYREFRSRHLFVNLPAYVFGYFRISRKFVIYSLVAFQPYNLSLLHGIHIPWSNSMIPCMPPSLVGYYLERDLP
jgi:uncharacterized membrane-anchored protein YitT (DUF2179 family)